MANGPVVNVAVTFHPPDRVTAVPERARVDWGKKERVRWRLASSDGDAVLHKVVFTEGDPLPELHQDPENPKVWLGGKCREVTGEFKYDIVVLDGDGQEIVLDPHVILGDPPG